MSVITLIFEREGGREEEREGEGEGEGGKRLRGREEGGGGGGGIGRRVGGGGGRGAGGGGGGRGRGKGEREREKGTEEGREGGRENYNLYIFPSAGCSPPTPPVNGSVSGFTSSRVGAQVTYHCDTDLVLVRERVATCTCSQSLQWLPSSENVMHVCTIFR